MLEKIQALPKWVYICLVLLIFAFGWVLYERHRAERYRTGGNGTGIEVRKAQELTGHAGAEIGTAQRAVERAAERAGETASTNQRAAEGLGRCQNLLDEIRADNRAAKQLLEEIISRDSTRTENSGPH